MSIAYFLSNKEGEGIIKFNKLNPRFIFRLLTTPRWSARQGWW
nr:MAG TPA: hypothetical protein [Caudoviricetes sp.]